jgi:AraC family transcriptional regulator
MRLETHSTHQALVASVLDLISRDLESDLSLARLAERAGVSAFHFHRVFCAIAGEPPARYVRRLRLERAALRLKYSRLPVTEVAFDAGYETHEAFTRAFKSRFGLPPRRFRDRESALADDAITLDVQPVIVRIPQRRIAYVRHVGPYDETRGAFEKVVTWARRRGLLTGAHLVGVYLDDQTITPRERTRCEVGVYVDDDAVGDGEVGVRALAGGDYAVIHYQGPSRERRRTYDLLYARWLPDRGRAPATDVPPFEVYSPFGGALEGFDAVTSVHVPLAIETVS